MKISMVSEHASPLAALGGVDAGGQNVHVAALSSSLAKRGHNVTVYTRRDDPDLPARVHVAPGLTVIHADAGPARHIPKDGLLPYIGALADGIGADWAGNVPDLVHAHFWMSGLAAIQAARRASGADPVPVVQTFHALGSVKRKHQGPADTSPAARAWLEPWVGRTADWVIATCPDEVFELKALGISKSKISIAPCGVDLALFDGAAEPEPRPRTHRILSVGRLVPRKGVDLVIQALPLLARAGFDDVELLIVGGSGDALTLEDDPEARRLRMLAKELGVEDRVTLRGQVPRDAMPGIFHSADAVVCAPWYEPFGIVPLEAMACGVPVVAAAVGGLRETVVHQETGLHVPPHDPEAIADAVARLLADPALRARMGSAGTRRARSRYSWDRVAADTEKAYWSVLASGLSRHATEGLEPLEGTAL
ncbi:glycosyltransferase [Arthrobacter cupressi]|uniref:Glycosyltransferase involved in cell wall bisynthesis n=1 Tax=Arthrobacter cupressi TaxID=1045773 RepID=A0A1G8QIZ1_9MICC|nr:glycosyltransferase [Arthrobacter cupressi]NYD78162.1 glycosyltransferase involved in cell wall biosynthesis [Arthrobacter cupressi]SDJ04764.1 Glycosyltransferase involved in cell wall bisynthesis [Arthrobacter cupressi]